MRQDLIRDLSEGTEFRLTVQSRPPRIVHGSIFLLIALLVSLLAWAGFTRAELVVRARGRVRPLTSPVVVRTGARAEVLSASLGNRVAQVNFTLGQTVKKGDMLVHLDTDRLDIDILKKKQTLIVLQEERNQILKQEEELELEVAEAKKKAEAELTQARDTISKEKTHKESDRRLLEQELGNARREEAMSRQLYASGAASRVSWEEARLKLVEVKEKLIKARLPVDEGSIEIARRALNVLDKQYAGKKSELALKKTIKAAEAADTQKDLENHLREREQANIRAPFAGVITSGDVKVGTILDPQKPILEIAEDNGFLFVALVPNEEVGNLRVDMPARIKLDAYDYLKYGAWDGKITFVSPDSVLGDSPAKATFQVEIRFDGTKSGGLDLTALLKLGMTGQAEIVTDQQSLLFLLVKQIHQSISIR